MERGHYLAYEARTTGDIRAAQRFRAACFGLQQAEDADPYDIHATHVLIKCLRSDALVCCFRMLNVQGSAIDQSYSAQFYDLRPLQRYAGAMLEIGRFCSAQDMSDPDVLRLAWAVITRHVDAKRVSLLFGSTSFAGVSAAPYAQAFALLRAHHQAPTRWTPRCKSRDVVAFAAVENLDLAVARRQTPPLLRSYLTMGGWVSDHAVIDRQMNTMHVFTAVEVARIPPTRQKLLRALS
ncbi:MAG: GNAT family N-acetyltransferase [Roseobacter sp.]